MTQSPHNLYTRSKRPVNHSRLGSQALRYTIHTPIKLLPTSSLLSDITSDRHRTSHLTVGHPTQISRCLPALAVTKCQLHINRHLCTCFLPFHHSAVTYFRKSTPTVACARFCASKSPSRPQDGQRALSLSDLHSKSFELYLCLPKHPADHIMPFCYFLENLIA